MTERMIENRVKKIQDLEAQKEALEKEIERLKTELKTDLEEKGVSEIKTQKGVVVRWQEIVSSRLNGTLLKKDLPDLYEKYQTSSVSHRFTWKCA